VRAAPARLVYTCGVRPRHAARLPRADTDGVTCAVPCICSMLSLPSLPPPLLRRVPAITTAPCTCLTLQARHNSKPCVCHHLVQQALLLRQILTLQLRHVTSYRHVTSRPHVTSSLIPSSSRYPGLISVASSSYASSSYAPSSYASSSYASSSYSSSSYASSSYASSSYASPSYTSPFYSSSSYASSSYASSSPSSPHNPPLAESVRLHWSK
jgi:hypothetical protein